MKTIEDNIQQNENRLLDYKTYLIEQPFYTSIREEIRDNRYKRL